MSLKTRTRILVGDFFKGVGLDDVSAIVGLAYEWSDNNLPWAYTSTSQFREKWPAGVVVVPLQTGSADFYTNLKNTLDAQASGARVVVELPVGVFHLTKFRVIGTGTQKTYSFGFWFPKLRGFVGQGPDKTFIQLDANAITVDLDGVTDVTAQAHTEMENMDQADYAPIQRALCRIDGTATSQVILSGLTFRAADQLPLTAKHSSLTGQIALPQPSPHNGVNLYDNGGNLGAIVSYVRFQAAGRAMNSQPPFETANAQTGRGTVYWDHVEFDGRRSADIDPARPRRCGPVMTNGETISEMTDCYLHHSNLSRYAANDQNRDYSGIYRFIRCKAEQITNVLNVDPNMNGGNSLGGYTNASPFGFESSNATITFTDCIVSQDNPYPTSGTGQIPMHYQLSHPGGRNPQGGKVYINGGRHHWVHPQLEGFVGFRIGPTTPWWTDGFDNTIFVTHEDGQRLAPHQVTVTWPPTKAYLDANNIKPSTHYLIRAT